MGLKHYFFVAALLLLWGCDYARMKEQESVRTYEISMPEMAEDTIPVTGGLDILKRENPEGLRNPLPDIPASIARGRKAYGYYCIHCHGPQGAGKGTVGQSFFPLPTDLTGGYVQKKSDGELFYRISLGYKRHPPLANTASEEDRWAIILYIRSLAEETAG